MTSKSKSVPGEVTRGHRPALRPPTRTNPPRAKLALVSSRSDHSHEPLSELAPVGPTTDF